MPHPKPRLVSVHQYAKMKGLSSGVIYRMIREGKIKNFVRTKVTVERIRIVVD